MATYTITIEEFLELDLSDVENAVRSAALRKDSEALEELISLFGLVDALIPEKCKKYLDFLCDCLFDEEIYSAPGAEYIPFQFLHCIDECVFPLFDRLYDGVLENARFYENEILRFAVGDLIARLLPQARAEALFAALALQDSANAQHISLFGKDVLRIMSRSKPDP